MGNSGTHTTDTDRNGFPATVELPAEDLAAKRAAREQAAAERQRRRRRGRRLRRVFLLATPLFAALAWYARPMRVRVDDRPVWIWRGTTVQGAIDRSGLELPFGDLLDIRGGVLKPGGGKPPTALSHGQPVASEAKAFRHHAIALQRGADLREPTVEQVQFTPPLGGEDWQTNWRPSYLAAGSGLFGLTRTEQGELSGLRAVVDEAKVRPISASQEDRRYLPKLMALTFDDGPNDDSTRRLLEILAQHGARATFFLLGDCIGNQGDLVREEIAAGHEVANHSWGHPLLSRMSVDQALARIKRAEDAIAAAGAKRCRWFRPPYGATTADQRKAILAAGYHIALWSVDTEDWRLPGADTIHERIMSGAGPGAIVLCHDGGGPREQTLAAIERAVPDLVAQGYQLVTLSELVDAIPGDDGGVTLLSGKDEWRAHFPTEPIRVIVAGKELEALAPMLVVKGKVLLPVGKVLDPLGAKWEWDAKAQAITITSVESLVRLRLDSPRVTWNGKELRLDAPPILYHGVPLASAEVLARAAGAQLQESLDPRTLVFALASAGGT